MRTVYHSGPHPRLVRGPGLLPDLSAEEIDRQIEAHYRAIKANRKPDAIADLAWSGYGGTGAQEAATPRNWRGYR